MGKTVFTGSHRILVGALIAARHELGLNQTQLGERLGRDQKFVSLVESGQRRIDVVEFCAYCRALGREPVAFLGSFIAEFEDTHII